MTGFVLLVALATSGLTFAYLRARFSQIPRLQCAGCIVGAGPMTVLFIGSDTRSSIPHVEAMHFCLRPDCSDQVGPEHSDAIMLMRIDPGRKSVALLSIPRDLNVPIAGTGRRDRINVAFSAGPARLVDTIRNDLGIEVTHFVVADFEGFRAIVDTIGGLDVSFTTPARDVLSGLVIDQAGCSHLDGKSSLAYVRSRHYESFERGRWRADPQSDLSRIRRQQDFIRRLIHKVLAMRNPFAVKHVVDTAVHWVKVDDRVSAGTVLRIALSLRSSAGNGFQAATLPTRPIRVGSADELRLQEPEASATIAEFVNAGSARGSTSHQNLTAAVPPVQTLTQSSPPAQTC